jgi:hypothetical protein
LNGCGSLSKSNVCIPNIMQTMIPSQKPSPTVFSIPMIYTLKNDMS